MTFLRKPLFLFARFFALKFLRTGFLSKLTRRKRLSVLISAQLSVASVWQRSPNFSQMLFCKPAQHFIGHSQVFL